ncbi:BolA family transcriptional regulator [Pelagibacteraceae bacterium]|nr:BolA family transcriptional regulator [Pelagibacteraceae bacterium]
MNDFLKIVENKIKKNIKVERILIIDNSDLHKKHKFFNSKKYHLKLEIESIYLKSLDKIKAQREIMTILSEELKSKIHALEIKIK